jgi:hypothetical protein
MDAEKTIKCEIHGKGAETFMCQHLVTGAAQGFHCADDPSTVYPDAWCDACNQILEQQGGWNEVSEAAAGIKLICSNCYEIIRARNQRLLAQKEFEDLFHQSVHRLQDLNDEWLARFGLNRDHEYYYDSEAATITFSRDSQPLAIAQMQFVGSYSSMSNSWLWSWANTSAPGRDHELMWRVKDFGDEHGIEKLSRASWTTDNDEGWLMTAVTVKLLDGIGGYRVNHDHLWMYFALLAIEPIVSGAPEVSN